MQVDNKIVEATKSSFFDTGISETELKVRKISTARVLNQAQKALEIAEKSGQDSIANQLRDKIDLLQDWLDHADDIPTGSGSGEDDGSDMAGGAKADKEDTPEDTEDSDDSESSDNDSEDALNGGDSEGSSTDSSKKKPPKKDPGEGPEGDPGEEPEKDPDEATPGEEPGGDPGDKSDKDSGDGPGGDPGEKPDEDKDGEEPGEDPGEEPGEDPEGDDGDEDGGSGGDGTEGESGGDGKKSNTKINPFEKPLPGMPTEFDPSEVESVFDAAKRILGKLSGDSRRGAVDGLKDLLSKRGVHVEESLHEAVKTHLATVSEDTFQDELVATMAIVDKVMKVDYSDDLEDRVAEIKRDASSAISRMELEREDAEYTKAERGVARNTVKASKKENEIYTKIKGLGGLDMFKASLYNAVKDQVDEAEDEIETWAALDRRHEDDPSIIVKGKALDDLDFEIPSINVYFDQSGSWTDVHIEKGKRAISVINEFHENKEINLNIFYMSAGGIFTTAAAARPFGAAEGWADALKHIKESKVKNVVILSDSDLDSYEWSNRPTGDNGRTIVDGCVWWIWKDARVSNKALKELVGRRGNFQYQFKGSD